MGALHVNGQKATGVNITLSEGVFMDANNTIKALTEFKPSMSYEATEDCFVMIYIVFGSNSMIKIDNKPVANYDGNGNFGISNTFYVKAGQTISVSGASASYNSYYIVYGIQQGTIEGKLQPVIYSIEEREIGVWTDGKPLYQKTVRITSFPNNQLISIPHNISSIDNVVYVAGTAHIKTSVDVNNNFVNFPRIQDTDATANMAVDVNNTNILLKGRQSDFDYLFDYGYVTLQYTKTTDQAGAGTWTPDGAYAHHYSTDEHIVGTYEGETLYERNIDITLADSSDMQTFAPGTLGIGPIKVIIDSYFKNSGGQQLRMSRWYGNDYWSYIVGSNGGIMIKRNASDPNWTTDVHFVATVQYTKSS